MLRTGPWNRLALTVRWLKQEYQRDFPPDLPPPLHMAIAYGLVKSKNLVKSKRVKKDYQDEGDLDKGDKSETVEEDDLCYSQSTKHARCAVCCKRVQVGSYSEWAIIIFLHVYFRETISLSSLQNTLKGNEK